MPRALSSLPTVQQLTPTLSLMNLERESRKSSVVFHSFGRGRLKSSDLHSAELHHERHRGIQHLVPFLRRPFCPLDSRSDRQVAEGVPSLEPLLNYKSWGNQNLVPFLDLLSFTPLRTPHVATKLYSLAYSEPNQLFPACKTLGRAALHT